MAWFNQIAPWHWLILGILLVTIEILAPGAYFLWGGIAAIIVAILLLALPELTFPLQVIFFTVLTIAAAITYKQYRKRYPSTNDEPALNRRTERYINQTFTLTAPIINGRGTLKADDATWDIRGDDAPAGSHVRVTAADDQVLTVVIVDKD